MSTTNCGSDVLCHIACHSHSGIGAVVSDGYFVVSHLGVIDINLVDVTNGEHLATDGECGAIFVGHLSDFGSGESISHIVRHDVQCLGRCCHSNQ